MSKFFKDTTHIRKFFEKSISEIIQTAINVITLIIAILSIKSGSFKIFIEIILFISIVFSAYKIISLFLTETKNVFDNEQEIKNYMKNWVNNDGQTVIVSRDLSWVSLNDDIYNLLCEKAKNDELTIIMQKPKPCVKNLEKLGAKIYYYSNLDFTPKTRFTFIHYGRTNPRLAIGYQSKGITKILEYEKSGTIEYSLAEDLCNLLKKVSKNENSPTETQ